MELAKQVKILRLNEVLAITGLSASTVWRLEKQGVFPRRVKLSMRAVGWHYSDIKDWVDGRSKT